MTWDLANLQTLAAVVEHGSLDAAARHLHLTPSAVSLRLRALERAVGAVLLQRTRPVAPTAAGERVLLAARQIEAITRDLNVSGPDAGSRAGDLPMVTVAINADSLATWALPALAPLADSLPVHIIREDQDHTAALLRDGSAMAAITSQSRPIQGCRAEPLGAMRYRAVASSAVVARYPGLVGAEELAQALERAPVLTYDDKDTLQDAALSRLGLDPQLPPRHLVPASTQFAQAIALGFGWGMLPEQQIDALAVAGTPLMDLPGVAPIDVPLYWQQWTLHTASLERVAEAIRMAAARALRPLGRED